MNRHLVMPGLTARMTPEQVRLLFRRQVFKFYHAKDSHSVIDQATVRIGTLQGYRKIENPALRDDSEGVSSSRPSRGLFFQGGGKSPDPELHPQSLMTRVGAQWASRFDVVIGGSFEFAELFDFYVYCFSYECSVSVAKSFNPPFDSVARIDDVFAFAGCFPSIIRSYGDIPMSSGRSFTESAPVTLTKPIHCIQSKPSKSLLNSRVTKKEGLYLSGQIARPTPFSAPFLTFRTPLYFAGCFGPTKCRNDRWHGSRLGPVLSHQTGGAETQQFDGPVPAAPGVAR